MEYSSAPASVESLSSAVEGSKVLHHRTMEASPASTAEETTREYREAFALIDKDG